MDSIGSLNSLLASSKQVQSALQALANGHIPDAVAQLNTQTNIEQISNFYWSNHMDGFNQTLTEQSWGEYYQLTKEFRQLKKQLHALKKKYGPYKPHEIVDEQLRKVWQTYEPLIEKLLISPSINFPHEYLNHWLLMQAECLINQIDFKQWSGQNHWLIEAPAGSILLRRFAQKINDGDLEKKIKAFKEHHGALFDYYESKIHERMGIKPKVSYNNEALGAFEELMLSNYLKIYTSDKNKMDAWDQKNMHENVYMQHLRPIIGLMDKYLKYEKQVKKQTNVIWPILSNFSKDNQMDDLVSTSHERVIEIFTNNLMRSALKTRIPYFQINQTHQTQGVQMLESVLQTKCVWALDHVLGFGDTLNKKMKNWGYYYLNPMEMFYSPALDDFCTEMQIGKQLNLKSKQSNFKQLRANMALINKALDTWVCANVNQWANLHYAEQFNNKDHPFQTPYLLNIPFNRARREQLLKIWMTAAGSDYRGQLMSSEVDIDVIGMINEQLDQLSNQLINQLEKANKKPDYFDKHSKKIIQQWHQWRYAVDLHQKHQSDIDEGLGEILQSQRPSFKDDTRQEHQRLVQLTQFYHEKGTEKALGFLTTLSPEQSAEPLLLKRSMTRRMRWLHTVDGQISVKSEGGLKAKKLDNRTRYGLFYDQWLKQLNDQVPSTEKSVENHVLDCYRQNSISAQMLKNYLENHKSKSNWMKKVKKLIEHPLFYQYWYMDLRLKYNFQNKQPNSGVLYDQVIEYVLGDNKNIATTLMAAHQGLPAWLLNWQNKKQQQAGKELSADPLDKQLNPSNGLGVLIDGWLSGPVSQKRLCVWLEKECQGQSKAYIDQLKAVLRACLSEYLLAHIQIDQQTYQWHVKQSKHFDAGLTEITVVDQEMLGKALGGLDIWVWHGTKNFTNKMIDLMISAYGSEHLALESQSNAYECFYNIALGEVKPQQWIGKVKRKIGEQKDTLSHSDWSKPVLQKLNALIEYDQLSQCMAKGNKTPSKKYNL